MNIIDKDFMNLQFLEKGAYIYASQISSYPEVLLFAPQIYPKITKETAIKRRHPTTVGRASVVLSARQ